MQRARWEVVLRCRERQRQGCRRVRPGQGARHWRLCPKRLLDREQEREFGREVAVEGKPRPAVSAPTKLGAGFYWLAVLWSRGLSPSGCWATRPAWLRQGECSHRGWTPDWPAH
jgi:hypothetical protein